MSMFWKFLNDRRNPLNKKKEEKYEIYKKFYEKEQENDQQVKEKNLLKVSLMIVQSLESKTKFQ